jgi:hypothetical protein
MLKKHKKIKLIILLTYVFLACVFVYFLKPVYLLSIIIVLVPPTTANFLWLKKSKKKILVFSLVTTILFAFAVELSSRLANSWDVQSILPRLFGIAPLENILFAFINFFWVLSFYEYFVDMDLTEKISNNFKYLIALFSLFSLVIFTLYFYKSNLVAINYFTIASLTLIIPAVIIFLLKPKLLKKTVLTTVFFAIVFFVYEIVSLINGSWWWPGEYILPVNIFGKVFPLDDVVIWYFLSTIALIGGYEFFADDFK